MAASRRGTNSLPSRYSTIPQLAAAIKDLQLRAAGGSSRAVVSSSGGGGGSSEVSTYTDFLTTATVNKTITVTAGEVWAVTDVDLQALGVIDLPATSELLLIG